jgi:hypothetical protein
MSVIPLRRSDTPGPDYTAGGPDPVPAPIDGEHIAHVRRAYMHAAECVRHLGKALNLLDTKPIEEEPGDNDDVTPADPTIDNNPQGDH